MKFLFSPRATDWKDASAGPFEMVNSTRVCSLCYHSDSNHDACCFRFVPLPKSGNPERVVSNVDIFNFELSSEDMAQLDGLDKGDAGAISWNPVNCD